MSTTTQEQTTDVLAISGIILAMISVPVVFCGGLLCLWMPLISIFIGIYGLVHKTEDTDKQSNARVLNIMSIIISVSMIAWVILSSLIGFGALFLGLLAA